MSARPTSVGRVLFDSSNHGRPISILFGLDLAGRSVAPKCTTRPVLTTWLHLSVGARLFELNIALFCRRLPPMETFPTIVDPVR